MPRIWTTTPVMTVPDGAPGVACAMTGAVWANSATATLFAAAPNDLSITTLIYKNPNPGAAACEAELILVVNGVEHVYPITTMGYETNGNDRFLLPVPVEVLAGELVQARVRWGTSATGSWELAIECLNGTPTGHVVTTRVPSKVTSPANVGTVLTPVVSWGTTQTWTQIIPATATAIVLGGINIYTNQVHGQFEVDVSTGAPGSEGSSIVTTIRQVKSSFFLNDSYGGSGYFFPLWPLLDNIGAGKPVSVRLRIGPSPWATGSWRCKLQYYEHPINIPDLTTKRPQTIVPAGSDAPGFGTAPSGTFSNWVEYIASTATEIAVTALTPFLGNVSGAGGYFEIQIGVGPPGTESVVGIWRSDWSTSGRYGDHHDISIRLATTIAAGQRVSLRCRWNTSSVGGLGIGVAMTYVAQPDFAQRTLPGGVSQVQIGSVFMSSPATAWTYGPWTVMVAALDKERALTEVADGYNSDDTDWDLELGVGVADPPTNITKVRGRKDAAAGGARRYPLPVPLKVPIGTKVWGRTRRQVPAFFNSIFWTLFGAELPADAPAKITVEKIVEPSSDTTAFQFKATGGLTPNFFQLSHGQTRVFTPPAGTGYGLIETPITNYETSIVVSNGSPPDNITAGIGEEITVTVRNTRLVNAPNTKVEYIRRLRQAAYISSENDDLIHDYFELHCQVGIGVIEGQGRDPVVSLSWSDDGGRTWSNEYPLPVGRLGDYDRAMPRWRKLGMSSFKGRIYRVVVSDPVDWVLVAAFLGIRKGR